MDNQDKQKTGSVCLVGAGIGDPDLITVAGLKALQRADVIVYDALANPDLLKQTRKEAEKIYAGKRGGEHHLTQEQTNQLLVKKAELGLQVVRLKGGDPYLFGRGAEEITFLTKCGVKATMIPGITSGIAGPALAGIPVTHRNLASTVTLITGHEDPTKKNSAVDYTALAQMIKAGGTACFYMGIGKLDKNIAALVQGGLDAKTPAAGVQWASSPKQKSVRGELSNIAQKISEAHIAAPAIVVIGQVARINGAGLDFFEKRPLFGQTIIVTRTRQQASQLTEQLTALGANVLEAPTIAIEPPETWKQVDEFIKKINRFDWLILTSANAVTALENRLEALNLDSRALAGVKISVVGKATQNTLYSKLNIKADFVPSQFTGSQLGQQLAQKHALDGKAIALLRGDLSGADLPQLLQQAGALVSEQTIYHTCLVNQLPDDVLGALHNKQVDWATFTSSSTAHHMAQLLGDQKDLLNNCKLASIGPVTSAAMKELGLKVTAQASNPGISQLVEAIVRNS